jgi:hypothetical protein
MFCTFSDQVEPKSLKFDRDTEFLAVNCPHETSARVESCVQIGRNAVTVALLICWINIDLSVLMQTNVPILFFFSKGHS